MEDAETKQVKQEQQREPKPDIDSKKQLSVGHA